MLYNKYRPKELSEIIGQKFITKVLQSEFEDNKTKQAYLFIGGGGQGKSSTAAVIAKMMNGYVKVVDAASNNSAEDMRNLISSVSTKPIGYDKTIVILEEAQGMSKNAMDVFLLTLEKVPKHLVFILTTTNDEKIPVTIKSRCETFYFNPVSAEEIADRLKFICEEEKLSYDERALILISKYAKGSVRLAISYLEQLSTEDITIDNVTDNLIKGSVRSFMNVVYAVIDNDIAGIMDELKDADSEKYCQELFTFALDVCIYFKAGIEYTNLHPIWVKELEENFGEYEIKMIDKIVRSLYDLQYKIKKSPTAKEELAACLILIKGE